MYIINIILVITGSLFMLDLSGQSKKITDFSHAIHVGDQFIGPTGVKVMRGSLKSVDWNKYRDKVLVLDFFSTGCATCIAAMPKLQALQRKHADKLQIINVTYQSKATLTKFFDNNKCLQENKVDLPVIYDDVQLRHLFPYLAEPHVVIIYKGSVRAITFGRLLTEENLMAIYNSKSVNLPLKDDYGKGALASNINDNYSNNTGVWLSGYQEGVRSRPLLFEQDTLSQAWKTSFYNRSILNALNMVWSKIKAPSYIPRADRIVWKVRDSVMYDNFDVVKELWDVQHAISYERKDRVKRPDSVQAKIVLQDLHSLLGVKSYYSTKLMDCLILINTGNETNGLSKSSGTVPLYENSSGIVFAIDLAQKFPPVKDMANRKGRFEIGPFSTLGELNMQLSRYGMKVSLGKAEMDVFVIADEY